MAALQASKSPVVLLMLAAASILVGGVNGSCFPRCKMGFVCCRNEICIPSRCSGRFCYTNSDCSSGESCCSSKCRDSGDCTGLSCSVDADCDGAKCCSGTCTWRCSCTYDSECPIGEHCCHGTCSSDGDCHNAVGSNSKPTLLIAGSTIGTVALLCVVSIFVYLI